YRKHPAVKLLAAGDVLDRLSGQPFVQAAPVVRLLGEGEFALRMGVQIDPLAAQRMRQQNLGREPGSADVFFFEDFRTLPEGGKNVQANHSSGRPRAPRPRFCGEPYMRTASCFSFSAW